MNNIRIRKKINYHIAKAIKLYIQLLEKKEPSLNLFNDINKIIEKYAKDYIKEKDKKQDAKPKHTTNTRPTVIKR